MIWLKVAGVSLVVAAIVGAEWRSLDPRRKKERAALVAVAAAGWLAAVLVLMFPNMPGPMELIDWICKPLAGKLS